MSAPVSEFVMGDIAVPPGDGYIRRVSRALDGRRVGAVALVTFLLSAEALSSSHVLEFFSLGEIALAWLEHLVELGVLAAALTIAYTMVDETLRSRPRRLRVIVSSALLFGLSVVLTVLLYAYYAHGFEHLPPPLRLLADSLRLGLPAVFLVLIADVHRSALQIDSAAHAAEMSRVQLTHDEAEQQLALLQAQLEPHFLFNVLGNVRRLYRTQPHAGSEAIASLMRYLHAALPQLRNPTATLGAEVQLVRAYLDLLRIRMGASLAFSIDVDPSLDQHEFPAMLAMTLVENAIKHGVQPLGGGTVSVRAYRSGEVLAIVVVDDGVGFGATAHAGTGVGLANVRRQLAARYGRQARLAIEARIPRGTRATISIPLGAAGLSADADRRECARP